MNATVLEGLRNFPGYTVEYRWRLTTGPTSTGAFKTTRGSIIAVDREYVTVQVCSRTRSGQPREEHFRLPAAGVEYQLVVVEDDEGAIVQTLLDSTTGAAAAAPPQQVGDIRGEEQRTIMVNEQRASSSAMMDFLARMKQEAADERAAARAEAQLQRQTMLNEQQATERKAERERQVMLTQLLESQKAAERKAEQQRQILLDTIAALQAGVPVAAPSRKKKHHNDSDDDDDESSDDGAATDVDDPSSCTRALSDVGFWNRRELVEWLFLVSCFPGCLKWCFFFWGAWSCAVFFSPVPASRSFSVEYPSGLHFNSVEEDGPSLPFSFF